MKYALLIYATPGEQGREGGAWAEYTKAMLDAGVFVAAERLYDTGSATSVRMRAGERLLTDGPFMETKEHLGGFYLIDVPGLDEALDWAARMPIAPHGTTEGRAARAGRRWQASL